MSRTAILLALGFLIAGCVSKTEVHGYVPLQSDLDKLQSGVSHKTQVLQVIGTPMFSNVFDQNRWHYVFFRTEQSGYSEKQIIEYKTLQILFNDQDILTSINLREKDDLVSLNLDPDITPSRGRIMSIGEQLFSNLGKK